MGRSVSPAKSQSVHRLVHRAVHVKHAAMRARLAFPILALFLAVPALGEEENGLCGIYPPDMPIFGGFSGCTLKRLGLPPLWQGLPKDAAEVIRLTFTDGSMYFFRTVTITKKADGAGILTVRGETRPNRIHPSMPAVVRRTIKLSPDDLARIDKLADASGAFKFERGSWDGDEDMFIHCQTLDLERANAAGYRVSVVNIGCNQPKVLMPFVREVVRLAKMKNGAEGMLFY